MGYSTEEAKLAVNSGYWFLYRYSPELKEAGLNPFQLDSKEPSVPLEVFLNGGNTYFNLTGIAAVFIFARCHKNRFAFLWHAGENEYRQKVFRSHAEKCGCRYPGGFQRRAGKPAFGTRSCSQGLVCYTFCSARRAKGWCRHPGQHTFTRRKRQPKTAKG